jgi:hypothetical protein
MNKKKQIILSLFFLSAITYTFIADAVPPYYPHASRYWETTNPDQASYNAMMAKFKEIAAGHLTAEQFEEFKQYANKEYKGGTCAGEAMTFLLSNPPEQPTLHIPEKSKHLRRIAFFQMDELARYISLTKTLAFKKNLAQYLHIYYPELDANDRNAIKLAFGEDSLSKIKDPIQLQMLQKLEAEAGVNNSFRAFKNALDKIRKATLASKGLKEGSMLYLLRNNKNNAEYSKEMLAGRPYAASESRVL